ncbi:MAG TPA: hypothetical protein VHK69_21680 [Chitinophagaceae bacterium]|jgi:hypothetical protein|nr:hypothetical protein [Chitinophagaceae bacterium]
MKCRLILLLALSLGLGAPVLAQSSAKKASPVSLVPAKGTPGLGFAPPSLSDDKIIGNAYFHADKQSSFYVTRSLDLLKLTNNKLEVIGRLAPLNQPGYKYMIYDNNTRFLVDHQGNILTTAGRKIGILRKN